MARNCQPQIVDNLVLSIVFLSNMHKEVSLPQASLEFVKFHAPIIYYSFTNCKCPKKQFSFHVAEWKPLGRFVHILAKASQWCVQNQRPSMQGV